MKCPVCDIDMVTEEVEVPGPNIMVDHCPKCEGIWLDKGELSSMLRSKAPERAMSKVRGLSRWGRDVCPRCKGPMQIKFVQDIEVDECTECKGLWLDKGELGRLKDSDLERSSEGRAGHFLRSLRDSIRKGT